MLKEKMLVPQLRFSEFEGEWKINKLGQIAKFLKGKGISKRDIINDGDNECIRYGELYTTYNEVIDSIASKTNVALDVSVLSNENDVIIPSSGETQLDIVTASCVLKKGVILGGDLNIIRTNLNGVFLSYLLNNRKKKDIAKLSQGNSVVHLYNKQLATLNLNLPTPKEQQKIANFLSAIDNRIQTLEKKKTLLEQYKKGVMQKIFKQELRFKDEYGKAFPEWEEKKLGEVCSKKSSNISANKIGENFGEYIIYGASGVLKKVDFYKEENDYVSIIKDGAGVGRIVYCKGKSSVLGTMEIIKPNSKLNTYFLYCLLENVNFKKYITGSTIPHIYFKDYKKEKCNIPPLEEQTKIANFLSAIDISVELVTKKIEHTKTFKKGLLQQMFV